MSNSEQEKENSAFPWWAWLIFVIVVLALLGGAGYYFIEARKPN